MCRFQIGRFLRMFSYYGIRDGFADLNGDAYITDEDLDGHLQENVVNYTRKAQHPSSERSTIQSWIRVILCFWW